MNNKLLLSGFVFTLIGVVSVLIENTFYQYIDEDGFLENENDVFTFKNDCYTLKGRNFGGISFNELKEHRVKEY